MIYPNQNEVWLYIDNPLSDRPWQLRWLDSNGEIVELNVRLVHIIDIKIVQTKNFPMNDNVEHPKFIIVLSDAKVNHRPDSLIAFVDRT